MLLNSVGIKCILSSYHPSSEASLPNMFDWTEGTDTRCNIACNVARNVAGVEASSTSATFHTTIAPCVHPIACNVARNVASCVRSLSHLGVKQATGGQNIISCNGATVQIHCLLLQARFTKALV